MISIVNRLARRTRRADDSHESGQALVEYALILLLIAFVAFTSLQVLGTGVVGALTDAAAGFGGA